MNTAVSNLGSNLGNKLETKPQPNPGQTRPTRRWWWFAFFVLAFGLLFWGGWQVSQAVWANSGLHSALGQSFDITVNGQPWSSEDVKQAAGGAMVASLVGLLLLVALLFLLPLALGAVLLAVLLLVGLVLSIVALPVLLVLALVMSPLLALLGLGWLLLA